MAKYRILKPPKQVFGLTMERLHHFEGLYNFRFIGTLNIVHPSALIFTEPVKFSVLSGAAESVILTVFFLSSSAA